jgi:Transposase, Mutator family
VADGGQQWLAIVSSESVLGAQPSELPQGLRSGGPDAADRDSSGAGDFGVGPGVVGKQCTVYTAPSESAALDAFALFSEKWEKKYPAIIRLWTNAWAEFVPFLQFDREIRMIICTTNAIESINARIRRAGNARGHFPTEAAALKCVHLGPFRPVGSANQRGSCSSAADVGGDRGVGQARCGPGRGRTRPVRRSAVLPGRPASLAHAPLADLAPRPDSNRVSSTSPNQQDERPRR